MPKIIPIRDMRDTNKISELCHSTDEPIFITKNGYGDMVLMSISTYENHMARIRMHDEIMRGVEQEKQGKLLDGETVMEELRKKYLE